MKLLALVMTVFISIPAFSALTEFITDSEGKKLMRSQADASAYCQSKGYKLPSPVTYADLMISQKKGIAENTKYPDRPYTDAYVVSERNWFNQGGYMTFLTRLGETYAVKYYYKHHNWPPIVDFDWVWTTGESVGMPQYYPEKGLVFNPRSKNGFEFEGQGAWHYFQCEMP
jgi:hypothetical protein